MDKRGKAAHCGPFGTVNWDGTLTLEYTFDPVASAAPEPGTLVLLGAGLAGLGFARRRKEPSV